MSSRFQVLFLLVAGLSVSPFAVAQDPATEMNGSVVYAVKQLTVDELKDGKRLVWLRYDGVVRTNAPWTLFHGNDQVCYGSVLVDADGSEIRGSGSCTAHDENGDTWSSWYEIQPELTLWTVIGGTGAYEGMTGGGRIEVTARGKGELAVNWFGTLQLK